MVLKPKAIFLDMDGTILNHQNKVRIQTKEIIDALRNQGIYVILATGRDADEIERLVPKGFQVDGLITSNGATGYVGKKVIFKHSLSLRLVETIINKARENKVYYELYHYGASRVILKQDQQYVLNEVKEPKPNSVGMNEWLSRKHSIKEEIAWMDKIEGNEFSKFYFFARTKKQINSWKNELDKIKQVMDFTTSSSTEHNVELMAANVNKATGIKQMLQHFSLSGGETLAIGDSDNDLPMLQFVSYAVAMKNAPEHIKEIADDVTEFTCDEDGVYHYLKSKVLSL